MNKFHDALRGYLPSDSSGQERLSSLRAKLQAIGKLR